MHYIIRRWIRNGIRRFRRFVSWFPIIWKDEDWDSAYLFEIMRHKISRLRKDMQKNGRHVDYENDVKMMKIAEELLNRHAFSDFYWDNREKEKEFCVCDPDALGVDENGRWNNPFCDWCQLKSVHNKRRLKEAHDFEYLWTIMNKYSQRWWN